MILIFYNVEFYLVNEAIILLKKQAHHRSFAVGVRSQYDYRIPHVPNKFKYSTNIEKISFGRVLYFKFLGHQMRLESEALKFVVLRLV